jgi:hypothetical protein
VDAPFAQVTRTDTPSGEARVWVNMANVGWMGPAEAAGGAAGTRLFFTVALPNERGPGELTSVVVKESPEEILGQAGRPAG